MNDTEKLLSEMQKPDFKDGNHKAHLRRALLNSKHFNTKPSKQKAWIPIYLGSMMAALIIAVVFFGPDMNYVPQGEKSTPQKIVSSIQNVIGEKDFNQKDTNQNIEKEETFALGAIRQFESEGELFAFYDAKKPVGTFGEFHTDSETTIMYSGRPEGGGGGGTTFSVTNNQEQEVDEADFVKNDNKYIFIARDGGKIAVFDAYPGKEIKQIDEISLGVQNANGWEGGKPDLHLHGDMLVAITGQTSHSLKGKPYSPRCGFLKTCPRSYLEERTLVKTYDVSNPTQVTLKDSFDIAGYAVESRMIDGYVYVTTYQNIAPQLILPSVIKNDEQIFVDAKDIYYNSEIPDSTEYSDALRFANILAIDTKSGETNQMSSLGKQYSTMYASENALYLIESENGFEASSDETLISKIAVDDLNVSFVASEKIPGWIESQFSLDEYKGYLRVAVTRNIGGENMRNEVYVLDGQLNRVGSITNLAPDERIYSVRFADDRGYVVTYREVDPLFVIDMSNPRDPKVLGELKIPGYSDYLHPYDENHLIGIGVETVMETVDWGNGPEQQERAIGLKMSLFDVTDERNPKELFTEIVGGENSSSNVLYEHKSFLFDKKKQLLVMPVTLREKSELEAYAKTVYDGAVIYNVNLSEGFTKRGLLSHLSPSEQSDLKENGHVDAQYTRSIQRFLYIDNYLYSISPEAIKVHNLNSLEELRYLEF